MAKLHFQRICAGDYAILRDGEQVGNIVLQGTRSRLYTITKIGKRLPVRINQRYLDDAKVWCLRNAQVFGADAEHIPADGMEVLNGVMYVLAAVATVGGTLYMLSFL